MSAVSLDRPGTADVVPVVRRIRLHPLRWAIDPPTAVTIRTTPEFVPDVQRWLLAPDAASEHDGVVDLRYTVTNRRSFRARIHVLGERVRIPDGGEFHAEMLDELRGIVG